MLWESESWKLQESHQLASSTCRKRQSSNICHRSWELYNCSIIVCLCPCSICWPIKMLKFMPNSSGFRLLSSAGAYTRQIQSKSAAFSGKLKKKFYKEMHKGFCYSIFRNFSRLCYGSPRAENCRNHINWQVLHVGKDRAQIFAIGAENCNCFHHSVPVSMLNMLTYKNA